MVIARPASGSPVVWSVNVPWNVVPAEGVMTVADSAPVSVV